MLFEKQTVKEFKKIIQERMIVYLKVRISNYFIMILFKTHQESTG